MKSAVQRIIWPKNVQILASRTYAARKYPYRFEVDFVHPKPKKISQVTESLAARGFLRPTKAYKPPLDSYQRITVILEDNGLTSDPNSSLDSPATRFSILRACAAEFSHSVPNSLLNSIKTVGDILNFYQTEVDTVTPFDALKTMELPENLHVQFDYKRFHPETDTMFGGMSIFPKSSTLVTGLKYKKKYKGHTYSPGWLGLPP